LPVCEQPLFLIYEGFEGQTLNTVSPSFDYEKSGVPITVKEGTLQTPANTGTRYFRFYSTSLVPASFWFYRLFPVTKPGETLMLSFYTRCSNAQGIKVKLDVTVGGVQVYTLNDCVNQWTRRTIDLSNFPGGRTQVKFTVTKTGTAAGEMKFDDFALFSSACPTSPCATFAPADGLCKVAQVASGYCFIRYDCIESSKTNTQIQCAVCKPLVNQNDWTPDDSLCTEQGPDVKGFCSMSDSPPGCYYP